MARNVLRSVVMLTRQNLRGWAILHDRWSDGEIKLSGYRQSVLLPHTAEGAQAIVFANEREIARFLADQTGHLKPVQHYVAIMRGFPSQAAVMTLEELAEEMDSYLPGVDRVPLHRDLLRAIHREAGKHVRNGNRRFYTLSDDIQAYEVISRLCAGPENVREVDHFRALRLLSSRSKIRLCRTVKELEVHKDGVFSCVRPLRGWASIPVLDSDSGVRFHYAVVDGDQVIYAMNNHFDAQWIRDGAHEDLQLPVVFFDNDTEFLPALPVRQKREFARQMPFDLMGAA